MMRSVSDVSVVIITPSLRFTTGEAKLEARRRHLISRISKLSFVLQIYRMVTINYRLDMYIHTPEKNYESPV